MRITTRKAILRALVTGGAGFIGRHLVRYLCHKGYETTIIDSGFAANLDKKIKNVKYIHSDINIFSQKQLNRIVEKNNLVFHLAAHKHNTKNISVEQMLETNITSTIKIAEACSVSKIEKLVFTSSLYAYGKMGPKKMVETDCPSPNTLYGLSKLMGEKILKMYEANYNLKWNVARLFFIYGPEQYAGKGYKSVIIKNFERLASNLPPLINGNGKQILDYVYVDDAVDALFKLAVLNKTSNIINISSNNPTSINQLIEMMQVCTKKNLSPLRNPADWTENSIRVGDNSLAKNLLNWTINVSMLEGLERTWKSITN